MCRRSIILAFRHTAKGTFFGSAVVFTIFRKNLQAKDAFSSAPDYFCRLEFLTSHPTFFGASFLSSSVHAVEFLADRDELNIVTADHAKNLQVRIRELVDGMVAFESLLVLFVPDSPRNRFS